ncbi:uncharacterized protein PAC_15005 [Phialocephala subalpina]|uniref:F-box domain-containing protein n=1 Tax=Phialocephala subalpina TaxID=576137 RepID=A0A1L7XJ79_9HELO|nr:uncharacterized protein PAC_15005 [Phialocephala subalpina]
MSSSKSPHLTGGEEEASTMVRATLKPVQQREKPSLCAFLDKLPREIRDHVYSYLLVDPILAEVGSIYLPGELDGDLSMYIRAPDSYDLFPSILRTCNKIHAEASETVYTRNTFIMDFTMEHTIRSPIFRHPITTTTRVARSTEVLFTQLTVPVCNTVLTKIKRWRVFLSAAELDEWSIMEGQCPREDFLTFCRAICNVQLLSLDVLLVPDIENGEEKYGIGRVLQPLQLLRNVQHLEISQANMVPWSHADSIRNDDGRSAPILPSQLISKIKTVVQGNSLPTHVFKKYDRIVPYAQAFERNKGFAARMKPDYFSFRTSDWSKFDNRGSRSYPNSPFKRGEIHPVENALEFAAFASEANDMALFKTSRQTVIDFLEPQFARIQHAALQVSSFVKCHKRPGRFLDIEGYSPYRFGMQKLPIYGEATLLLEQYAESFVRDIPYSKLVELRLEGEDWKSVYRNLPREVMLQKLSLVIEKKEINHDQFFGLFKALVDDMDKQYIEIRKTRSEVFESDPKDRPDQPGRMNWAQGWELSEMVDWSVNEAGIYDLSYYDRLGVTNRSANASSIPVHEQQRGRIGEGDDFDEVWGDLRE